MEFRDMHAFAGGFRQAKAISFFCHLGCSMRLACNRAKLLGTELGRPYSVWLPIPHGRISGWRGLHQDLHSHGGYVCLVESAALGDFLGKALTTFQQLQVQEAS